MVTEDGVDANGAAFDVALAHGVFGPAREASFVALSKVVDGQQHFDGVERFPDQLRRVPFLVDDHFICCNHRAIRCQSHSSVTVPCFIESV